MNYLTYISTSSKLFEDHDLKQMLEQEHIINNNAGITGVLLYNKGTFFHVLEGEDEQINAQFEKIKTDPRHHNIIKMKAGPIAKRNFAGWYMGFTPSVPDSLAQLPGFVDPAKDEFLYQFDSSHPGVHLLRWFVTTNNFTHQ